MNDLDDLFVFLYPFIIDNDTIKEHRAIQITLANLDKSVIGWYPGKRQKKFDWRFIEKKISKGSMIGITGRTYRTFENSMQKQSYFLHWIGIDVDDLSVEGLVSREKIGQIAQLIPECSIRYSTSGKGLHLIFRLDKPYFFEAGVRATDRIKLTLKPYVDILINNGIPVCCWSGGVFYVSGGKQAFCVKKENVIPLAETGVASFIASEPSFFDDSELNGVGKEFFDLIQEL
jgi:hypothetical protein